MLEDTLEEIVDDDDGRVFTLNFTGGLRAWKSGEALWHLGPITHDGKPVIKGQISTAQLQQLTLDLGVRAIAFEDCVVTNGVYHTTLRAILPGRTSQLFSAADVWRNIESNLTKVRLKAFLDSNDKPNRDQIHAVLDDKTSIEACSGYIGDSLRSIDISVSAICNHYNSQLVSAIRSGHDEDQRFSTAADISLYAHVHAFFLQIGAARDYLAKLISIRIGYGESKDSMAKLVDVLRSDKIPNDPMLQHIISEGYIVVKEIGRKMVTANWLKEVTDIRNQFVHKRPYGSVSKESMGKIEGIQNKPGFSKYYRGAVLPSGDEYDLLDTVAHHYIICNKLFHDISSLSGLDNKIITITDKDIISIKSNP